MDTSIPMVEAQPVHPDSGRRKVPAGTGSSPGADTHHGRTSHSTARNRLDLKESPNKWAQWKMPNSTIYAYT